MLVKSEDKSEVPVIGDCTLPGLSDSVIINGEKPADNLKTASRRLIRVTARDGGDPGTGIRLVSVLRLCSL